MAIQGKKWTLTYEEKSNKMKMEMIIQDGIIFPSKHTGSNPQLISAPVIPSLCLH